MAKLTQRQKGVLRNKLLRYKLIKEFYFKHKTEDIPTSVVLCKYIYTVYPISRSTLYEVLCTPVTKLLKELENQSKRLVF